jgi:hypothetical protein
LNEPRAQEPLNRDPTVDVKVMGTTGSQLRNDLSRMPGHPFNNASGGRGQVDGAATQDHYPLAAIRPGIKGQDLLEALAAYHNRIDACYKLVVPVWFTAALRQKVEIAVRSCNEAVEACPIKTDTVIVNSSPVAVGLKPPMLSHQGLRRR